MMSLPAVHAWLHGLHIDKLSDSLIVRLWSLIITYGHNEMTDRTLLSDALVNVKR